VIYLNEEIKAEALTKNLEGFTRFLFTLAAESSHFLDLSKVSKNASVPRQTVQRFFQILEDTLIIKRVEAFAKSEKRRLIQHPKFFFFDNGVLNSLLSNYTCSLDRRGVLFENFFFNQLSTSLSYSDLDYRLSTYRTDAGAEVDFVLELEGQVIAIEVKTGHFGKSDLGGFNSLERFLKKPLKKVVITDKFNSRKIEDIEVMPWQSFLESLRI
jgi:predicted AAA+ superfamily ATPase